MLHANLCAFSDTYIVFKGSTTVRNPNNDAYDKKKNELLEIMHRLFLAFQKLVIHSLTMQKI